MRVNRARVSLSVLGLAVIGSQAGHLLTYALRFGGAAQTQQSTGAHAYFPAIVKPVLSVAAMAVLATLLVVGFARLGAGRRVPHEPAPSFLRLLAVLYTVQLAFFALQETAEAVFSGAPPNSVEVLILWGTVGQLPVAVIAALALRWLLVRLRPALLLLRSRFESAFQLLPYTSALVLVPVETETAIASDGFANMLNPRGPPSS
jgi:hypothetical protein